MLLRKILILSFCILAVFGGTITYRRYQYGIWQPHYNLDYQKAAIPFLPENPIIVEAGAESGEDTVKMSNLWPKGFLHAFEPIPELFNITKNKTKELTNVCCYQLGLGNKNETVQLHLIEGGASSILTPSNELKKTLNASRKTIVIKTVTLDDWAQERNIDHVDLLWLDTQGFEPVILEASPNILKTVRVIITEVNLQEIYKGAILYPQFKKWLEEQGFVAQYERFFYPSQGEVMFVRKKLIHIKK